MPTPKNANPVDWAEYNASLAAMSPEEYELEAVDCRKPDLRQHVESVMSENLPWLTPSGELAGQVLALTRTMAQQASAVMSDPCQDHRYGREMAREAIMARSLLVSE